MNAIIAGLAGLMLSGCAITVPVALITQKGKTLRGTTTVTVSGGSFEVSGPGLSCLGSYNASTAPIIVITALCSDGRRAIITATRDPLGTSGGGKIRLSDGEEGDFIFGEAARRI